MKIEALGVAELKRCLRGALDSLTVNAPLLDNLNVFPVPDGDTGINMLSTLKPAVEAVLGNGVGGVASAWELLSEQANRNSRGNSGFILARFLAGFSRCVGDRPAVTADLLSQGFHSGSYAARSSLLTPVEGTMITIITGMAEAMAEAMAGTSSADVLECLRAALKSARRLIFETPRQLPVLARAGVVDAGALGFLLFVEGLERGLSNAEIRAEDESAYRFTPDPEAGEERESILSFRYCTELTVASPEGGEIDVDALKPFLEERGDSIALVAEKSYLKLHIHTDRPEEIAAKMAELGKVLSSKVDDMAEQLNSSFTAPADHEELAVLAVIPGPGFRQVFSDLEATAFLEYRERLPSSGEILAALEKVEGGNIIVLPNDKNIIPAAGQAREQAGKNVYVLPTANVVQGITALYGYSSQDSPGEAIRSMRESIGLARCLKVYRSSRDTRYGRVGIRKADYFMVEGEEVLGTESTLTECVVRGLASLDLSQAGCVSCFYNDDVDSGLLSSLTDRLRGLQEGLAVELCYGGQKNCLLIMALE
jgi:DAK2 domain fusion protein YloV